MTVLKQGGNLIEARVSDRTVDGRPGYPKELIVPQGNDSLCRFGAGTGIERLLGLRAVHLRLRHVCHHVKSLIKLVASDKSDNIAIEYPECKNPT